MNKYTIKYPEWKEKQFLTGVGFYANIGNYELIVKPRHDSNTFMFKISLRTQVIFKPTKADTIESAKRWCEDVWKRYVADTFLEANK